MLCAAPDYLKEAGQPAHPADLKAHNCLRYSLPSSPNKWFFTRDAGERGGGAAPASFCANNGIALKQAAVQGARVILVPDELCQTTCRTAPWSDCSPTGNPTPHALFAVYPSTRSSRATYGSLSNFLVKAFQLR